MAKEKERHADQDTQRSARPRSAGTRGHGGDERARGGPPGYSPLAGRHAQSDAAKRGHRDAVGTAHRQHATADRLHAAGLQLIAATEKGTNSPEQCSFEKPTVLIIGNEGTGIRPELIERVTAQVAIPQQGHIQSLNAAVAAGILCYEVQRQRSQM